MPAFILKESSSSTLHCKAYKDSWYLRNKSLNSRERGIKKIILIKKCKQL